MSWHSTCITSLAQPAILRHLRRAPVKLHVKTRPHRHPTAPGSEAQTGPAQPAGLYGERVYSGNVGAGISEGRPESEQSGKGWDRYLICIDAHRYCGLLLADRTGPITSLSDCSLKRRTLAQQLCPWD